MNLFTLQPEGFPQWPYPADTAGNLSTIGEQNAALLGAWYRDFYAAQGVLPAKGTCPAAGAVYVYADTFQRTLVTAQGYVHGLFQTEALPDCGVQVVQFSPLTTVHDPYIQTVYAGIANCAINTTQDQAAFYARIGGVNNIPALINTYSTQLQTLQTVTQCCQPTACGATATSCTLLGLPTTVNSAGVVMFAPGSLFDIADTITEDFELQYAQGMPLTGCSTTIGAPCVGWGAIPPGELQELTKLHVLNLVDLSSQLPSFAQVGSTNLMMQTVESMDQTLTGVKVPNALVPVASKFTLFVAHDNNIAALAEFLGGVSWKAQGFAPNDPGPAGALVFELRKDNQSGDPIVRLYYVIASLDQMRNNTILTLDNPPQRIPLAIPACGGHYDCPYSQFKSFITANVVQQCIYTPPA
jgi:4-phytase/acid phosphatase